MIILTLSTEQGAHLESLLRRAVEDIDDYYSGPHAEADFGDELPEALSLVTAEKGTAASIQKVLGRGSQDDDEQEKIAIDRARRMYASNVIEIDDVPAVSFANNGVWVNAWVWVPDEENGGE